MKTSILISILLFGLNAFAWESEVLMAWNPDIPTSADKVIDQINTEANYYSFDTDEGRCGGEALDPNLTAYTSFQTEDGNEVHEVVISFELEVPVEYCESVKKVNCQTTLQVYSKNSILMTDWICEQ